MSKDKYVPGYCERCPYEEDFYCSIIGDNVTTYVMKGIENQNCPLLQCCRTSREK